MLHKAQCEYDNEKFDIAIADLQEGLKLYETDPELQYFLGLSYYAQGNAKKDPNEHEDKDKDYKEALRTFKMALINMPKEDAGVQFSLSYIPDIYYHIGLAYCRVEKFEKSIYPYTKVSNFYNLLFTRVLHLGH